MGYRHYDHECEHKNCKYHMPPWSPYGCDYAGITGKTRTGQLPPEQHDPAKCPLHKRDQHEMATLEPFRLKGSNPQTESARARYRGGGKVMYDWERGRELYDGGASDQQIADTLGCSRGAVRGWRQRSGYLKKNEE